MSTTVDLATIRSDARLKAASDWIFRLHEDSLGEAEIAEWIQWCEGDAENLAAFETMEAVWKDLGELPEPVRSRLQGLASPNPTPSTRRWRSQARLAIAASIAAMSVGIGYLAWNLTGELPGDTPALQAGVARNQEATLPDGSLVALGAKSSLHIDYNGKERRLRMRDGQAFFSVKPDTSQPFVVEVGLVEVRAIGTAFDVRKNEGRVVVSVTEGKVEVTSPTGGADSRGRIQVTEGYQLVWDDGGKEMKLAATDGASAVGWRSGRLEYFGEPLWAVVANVNRYSSQPIRVEGAEIGELQFTGTVFTGATDDWVRMLPQAFPVSCERAGDGSFVIRPRT